MFRRFYDKPPLPPVPPKTKTTYCLGSTLRQIQLHSVQDCIVFIKPPKTNTNV